MTGEIIPNQFVFERLNLLEEAFIGQVALFKIKPLSLG
jgi:hypothetical protein